MVVLALSGLLALSPAPAQAAGFQLFGSYYEPDLGGEAVGIGFAYGFRIARPLDIDIRVTYFDTLESGALQDLFDRFGQSQLDNGIDIYPIDLGLRYNFSPENPTGTVYIGGGVSYYLLDAFRDVDDEYGAYVMLGAQFGGRRGPAFFVEGMYRIGEDPLIDTEAVPGLGDFLGVDFGLDGPQVSFGIALRKR